MIEGSGSRRPKNMWIRWIPIRIRIRIRNTDAHYSFWPVSYGSICFWAFQIRDLSFVRIWIRILPSTSKKSQRKTLISTTLFCYFSWLFIFEVWWKCTFKEYNEQKTLIPVNDEKSRIQIKRIRIPIGKSVMQIQIRPKISRSRILNAGFWTSIIVKLWNWQYETFIVFAICSHFVTSISVKLPLLNFLNFCNMFSLCENSEIDIMKCSLFSQCVLLARKCTGSSEIVNMKCSLFSLQVRI